ncbi:putative membrane protein, partial [Mycobacterium xenopi 3993]
MVSQALGTGRLGLMVAILIAVIIYGLVVLAASGGGAPSTT